jgi:uncharacterized protein YndB with AHSA1/START domain
MSDPVFTITRVFDAPRELVYDLWTDQKHLLQWFGPKGFTRVPGIVAEFRPGGTYHYGMRTPDGQEMWGKWVFRELKRPERLVMVQSFSDAKVGLSRHPMAPTWPLEMLSETTFEDLGGKTRLGLRIMPHNASPEETKTFAAAFASMEQGWGGTMEQLIPYLATKRQGRA